jgi:hypothetical protein
MLEPLLFYLTLFCYFVSGLNAGEERAEETGEGEA